MSLIQKIDYEPWGGIGFIEGEIGRIFGLLKDVRKSAVRLNDGLRSQRLDSILEIVEKEEWIIQNPEKTNSKDQEVSFNYLLDLSKAKELFNKYKPTSEENYESLKKSLRNYKDDELMPRT